MRSNTTSDQTSSQTRGKKKVTSAFAGLAITGILLAACTSASAGAAKPQPGQYRQATSSVQSTSNASERETLRQEHIGGNAAAPAKLKVSGTPTSNERESLRQEHLAK
jgi:hypothetical protein